MLRKIYLCNICVAHLRNICAKHSTIHLCENEKPAPLSHREIDFIKNITHIRAARSQNLKI